MVGYCVGQLEHVDLCAGGYTYVSTDRWWLHEYVRQVDVAVRDRLPSRHGCRHIPSLTEVQNLTSSNQRSCDVPDKVLGDMRGVVLEVVKTVFDRLLDLEFTFRCPIKITTFVVVKVYTVTPLFHHEAITLMPNEILTVQSICQFSILVDFSMVSNFSWYSITPMDWVAPCAFMNHTRFLDHKPLSNPESVMCSLGFYVLCGNAQTTHLYDVIVVVHMTP
jgi:hypothetical protein